MTLNSGIFALALEVNTNLTWRDLQHLIVRSSDKIQPTSSSWVTNGAGLRVSDYFGFGAINAGRLVEAASHKDWMTSLPHHVCISPTFGVNLKILNFSPVTLKHNTSSCTNLPNCVSRLEHVRLYVTLDSFPRGGLEIELVSPSGTRSHLLRRRSKDMFGSALANWGFMSLHFWGEDPRGQWAVTIKQTSRSRRGTLKSLNLELYGTCNNNTLPTATPTTTRKRTTEMKPGIPQTTSNPPESEFHFQFIIIIFLFGGVAIFLLVVFVIKHFKERRKTFSSNSISAVTSSLGSIDNNNTSNRNNDFARNDNNSNNYTGNNNHTENDKSNGRNGTRIGFSETPFDAP